MISEWAGSMAKKRSVLERAFTAAQRWVSNKGYLGYTEDREDHIAYRCGWYAGYAAARKDLKRSSHEELRSLESSLNGGAQ